MGDDPSLIDLMLPLEAKERIDRICLAFEEEWRSGARPPIPAYLGGAAGDERAALLTELLLLDLDYRRRLGERPAADEYQTRFPDDGNLIAGVFQQALRLDLQAPPPGAKVQYFGDYELLDEIARGGMGVVYKARQISLNRLVALKMVLAGPLAGNEAMKRFYLEAEAAAKLQHPNIVAIHEVGRHDGLPYFSMDYIEGSNLESMVREHPLPPQQAAHYVRTIAETIHYAHQCGILHRDLKPSNVIIDRQDQPRITDFGLVKWLAGDSNLTATDQVLGTPTFMPPEQAAAKHSLIGPPSDVYSMGAILYDLLTGRPPFRSATTMDTLRQVLEDEPAAPRLLNPEVPRDLETICLKCLQKEPHRRYATAALLAEDLQRFLSGKPIAARPIGRLERTWRWCRRQPVLASLTASVILLIVLVITGSLTAAWALNRQLQRAEQAEADAVDKLWGSYLAQAQVGRVSGRIGQRFESLEALAKAAAIRPSQALRYEAVACMQLFDLRFLEKWKISPKHEGSVVFSPTLEIFVFEDAAKGLNVCRFSDNAVLFRIPPVKKPQGTDCYFSPNGRLLAVKQWSDDTMQLWDVARRKVLADVPVKVHKVAFGFSPDSRRFAVGSPDGNIGIYDIASLKEMQHLKPQLTPTMIKYHPQANLIAVLDDGKSDVEVLDINSASKSWRLSHPGNPGILEWSPDGRLLAVAHDEQIHLWNVPARSRLGVLEGKQSRVTYLAFNHAGNVLTSCGWDNITRFWDPFLCKELLNVPGCRAIQFSADDRRLAFCERNAVGLWEIADRESHLLYRVPGEKIRIYGLDISPDGRLVACADDNGVSLWDSLTFHQAASLPLDSTASALFCPDGRGLVTSSRSGVRFWPIQPGTQIGCLRFGPPERMSASAEEGDKRAALTPDGRWLAAITGCSHITVFDLKQPGKSVVLPTQPPACFVAISPDGRWVADGTWSYASGVRIWDAHRGNLVRRLLPDQSTVAVAFSPDGKWLVTEHNSEYQFWETDTWRPHHCITRILPEGAWQAAFSSDGNLMSIVVTPYILRLIEPATGRALADFPSFRSKVVASACFSPRGDALAIVNDECPEIWDLRRVRKRLQSMKLDWNLPPIPQRVSTGSLRPLTVEVLTEKNGQDRIKGR
jgi:eukaryotic-like serine/threonine-protein kinase